MKKRVRIYKAPNQEGNFVNKTAQFLKKAQDGGAPDPSMMGYPGAQQQQEQPQQMTEDQLASIVLNDISASTPREGIVVKLVNMFGKEPMEAMQFVDQMYQYVEQQQQSEIDSAEEEDAGTDEEIVAGADVAGVEVQPEEPESVSATNMANDIALEDTPDDDAEAAYNTVMQFGGYYRAQEGMEVPIEMPDMSAYLPQNMSYYYGDPNAPSEMAWAAPQMPEDVDISSARYGGSKKSKKQFVNSVLKLVKKQMGGSNQEPESAAFTDDNADPTGSGIRKKNLSKFIGSIKNESAIATAQKQAEDHYDQMMQMQQQALAPQYPMSQMGGEQDIYQGQDYENPMHHLALFSQATGDVFGQDQNQTVQAQVGGSINNPFADQYGNLQKFIGGGNENFTQGDLDYTYSKNTANGDFPMAQDGLQTEDKSGMDIDPGFSTNPATGKPWTSEEWAAQKQKGDEAAEAERRRQEWIDAQMNKGDDLDPRSEASNNTYTQGYPNTPIYTRGRGRGMNIRNLFPANVMPQQYTQMQRGPYNTQTGKAQTFIPGAGTNLKSIDVKKTSWLTGAPKKYTVTFGNQEMDPTKQNIISLPGSDEATKKSTDMDGLGMKAKMAIRSGERQMNRNDKRLARDPELFKKYGDGPKAQTGVQTPITYTNNPAFAGMSDVDLVSLNPGIEGLENSTLTSFMNTNTPTRDQSKDPEEMIIDPNQIGRQQAEKTFSGTPGDTSIDFKTKNKYDKEAIMNVANAGIRGVTGMIDRARNKKSEAKMYDNLTADNLYASDPSKDRGDYDTNTGLFRMDEQGQQWNSRSKKYGGNIYQDGGMVEGDEMFMTDAEIQEFLANGGDLEFI
jgi:hypothetical protein